MAIHLEKVAITTTGSAGAAVGSGVTGVINGFLEQIFLDFHASTPNTTDTTIAYTTRGGNVLVVTNSATDAMLAPRVKCVDNANGAITNSHSRYAMSDTLTISLAQADALANALVAWIWWSDP